MQVCSENDFQTQAIRSGQYSQTSMMYRVSFHITDVIYLGDEVLLTESY